jgi:hypothetical protein
MIILFLPLALLFMSLSQSCETDHDRPVWFVLSVVILIVGIMLTISEKG